MLKKSWNDVVLPPGNPNHVWELFHENSKAGRFERQLPSEAVMARMQELHDSLPYDGFPETKLPHELCAMRKSLTQAVVDRISCRTMEPIPLSLVELGTLLYCAYGLTRSNEDSSFIRPFRTVPSGGGLFPLEIYFHTTHVEGLRPGLYHYNAFRHKVYQLREGDFSLEIAETLVQKEIAVDASVVFFITAMFDRTVFKYGDRGYRFTLLEAGHVAQNINLISTGLGLGVLNIGGFFDRGVDLFLRLDGLSHSSIYIVAVGKTNNASTYSEV